VAFISPKTLNMIFPKIVTGSLLLLVGVYLVGNGMQN
jgi:xanthine/uracil permease